MDTLKTVKKYMRNIILISLCILALFFAKGFFRKKPLKEIPPKPVETALAIQDDAAAYIDSFGNMYSLNDVNIKSQVTGAIKEIRFKEGQDVKEGDLLFIIDPSPYQAALDKARAALMQDLANLKLKKATLDRNRKLFEKELISQQDFDTYQTDVASGEAQVRLDAASIELAKIDLDYCYVKSPVIGLTGKRKVDLGNIVTANNGPTLVNIKTIDPLYVDFTIPERSLTEVRNSLKTGKLKVEVLLEEQKDVIHEGQLELLDNTVDNNTGTILLRAIVPNKERNLWAGQFVQVRLILSVAKNAVLVPYDAVQLGQQGSFLFVITADNKADLRLVKTGSRKKDNIVIEKGVSVGERVVTSGQLGLSPGAKVIDITEQKE